MINKKYNTDLITMFLLYLVIFVCMYIPHYATDTFYAIANADIYGKGNISLGRYGCELVYFIARLCNINYEKSFFFLITMMIVMFAIFSAIVSVHIQKLLNVNSIVSKWVVRIALVIVFANSFAQEWFTFWECGLQWSFSVLFLGLALIQIKDVMKLKSFIASCVFLTLGLGFYQAVLPIFLILGCTIIYLKNDGVLSGKSIFGTITVIIIGGLSSVVNLLSIKFFQAIGWAYVTGRTDSVGVEVIINNIKVFISVIPNLIINNFGLYPKYLFASIALILIVGTIINIISKKEKISNKIFYMILLIMFSLFSIFIPHLFTTSLWLAQRTLVGFWSIGSMLILVYWKTAQENEKAIRISVVIATIMLISNYAMIQSIEMDTVMGNRSEQQNALVIQNKILEYECKTGINVKYIGVMYDENIFYCPPIVKYKYCDTNRSALATSWSDVTAINFYNKTDYIKVDVPEEIYEENARGKNWDYFDPSEQLLFDNDTLYIIIY